MRPLKKYKIFFALVFASIANLQAQQVSRFSISTSAGTAQSWHSQTPGSGLQWTGSIGFVPHRLFTVELENERGSITGRNKVVLADGSSVNNAFRTSYNYWGGLVSLNLFKLFAVSRKPRVVTPYLYGGVGYLDFTAERLGDDNTVLKRFSYNTYTTKIGLKLRIRVNAYFDCLAAVETTSPQSFYVDANPVPNGYDHFTSLKLGVSYKIAAKGKREYIDWKYHGPKESRSDWFY